MQLDRLTAIPPSLRAITPREIKQVFPNPTLIHLRGESEETIFVSTLLHGNETTSFEVLQYLENAFAERHPKRGLLIFVGNVDAVAAGRRFLPGQMDFNRIWAHGSTEYHALIDDVVHEARSMMLFASVDIHNNTGANPIYGCVNTLRPADLQLAKLFAPIGVLYHNPPTTQSIAFSQLCPAITLECGQSGDPEGVAAAIALLDHVLELDAFDTQAPSPQELRLYETIGRVVIDDDASISFDEHPADIVFRADLESMNFKLMPALAEWGQSLRKPYAMRVRNEHGEDITQVFFKRDGEQIRLAREIVPAMITHDQTIIRQDCLCYLMQEI